MKEEIIKRLA
jgi:hypothetical protein